MKKTLLVLLICLGNYSISLAQDSAFMEDALKLTRYSNDAVEASFGQLYAMIPAEKLEDFKEELKPVLDNYYTKMAKVSMEFYSHEDVKQLLDFYESDLGQKMLDAQAKLTVRSMEMAQPLSMELMPIVQKYTN